MLLSGIRLLDLSRMLPGPYGTMLLADLGVEVIRVENPEQVDLAMLAPPMMGGIGSMFLQVNRNKKSMNLNLKREGAAGVFMDLAKTSDVVLEQFRPGVMDRLGIGYGDIKKVKPDIIYCSLTGFGQDGPYKDRPGHDINYLSLAGFLDANRRDGKAPVVPGFPVADLVGGIFAAMSVLAALCAKERTGSGQRIDVAITDAVISMACILFGELVANDSGGEAGLSSLSRKVSFYDVYETKDGEYVSIGAIEPKFWRALCKEIGHEELVSEQYVLGKSGEAVTTLLAEIFRSRTKRDWEEKLGDKGVMFSPVNSLREVVNDPHVISRGLIGTIRHDLAGDVGQIRSPMKFSEPIEYLRDPPPLVGEHTDELLMELGYDRDRIEEMRRREII